MRLNKTTLLLGLFLYSTLPVSSQQLIYKDFHHLPDNTTARINQKSDVNGKHCAVLIIKHNIENFVVETGIGYEAIQEKVGETWIWISADEYRIILRKTGYIPFAFDLKDKLKPLETYELLVTDEFCTIFINAPQSKIWLDGKLLGSDHATFTLKEGKYIVRATRDQYESQEKLISIVAGEYVRIDFDLLPVRKDETKQETVQGEGVVSIVAKQAQIYIDHSLVGSDSINLKLMANKYLIQAKRERHESEEVMVLLSPGDTIPIKFDLKPTISLYEEINNNKSNYLSISAGHGVSYGSSWGGSIGVVFGDKPRIGCFGGIGVFKDQLQYNLSMRVFIYQDWSISLGYGTNGYIYNSVNDEFLYLNTGTSFLLSRMWFFSKNVGLFSSLGGFYDLKYENEIDFMADAGIIVRF